MLVDKLPWCSHDGYPIFSVDCQSKGGRFATGGGDGTARIWSLSDAYSAETEASHAPAPAPLCVLSGQEGGVGAVRFSPDGKQLATGSDDGLVTVYEYAGVERLPGGGRYRVLGGVRFGGTGPKHPTEIAGSQLGAGGTGAGGARLEGSAAPPGGDAARGLLRPSLQLQGAAATNSLHAPHPSLAADLSNGAELGGRTGSEGGSPEGQSGQEERRGDSTANGTANGSGGMGAPDRAAARPALEPLSARAPAAQSSVPSAALAPAAAPATSVAGIAAAAARAAAAAAAAAQAPGAVAGAPEAAAGAPAPVAASASAPLPGVPPSSQGSAPKRVRITPIPVGQPSTVAARGPLAVPTPAAAAPSIGSGALAPSSGALTLAPAAPPPLSSGVAVVPPPQEAWRRVAILRAHDADVTDLSWSPDGFLLASASLDGTACVWEAGGCREAAGAAGAGASSAAAAAPRRLVARLRVAEGAFVKGVAFDPVGRYLAVQSDDKALSVYSTSSWERLARPTHPFQRQVGSTFATRPSWSPDGQWLLAGNSYQGASHAAVLLPREGWNDERERLLVAGHHGAVVACAFDPKPFHLPADRGTRPRGGGNGAGAGTGAAADDDEDEEISDEDEEMEEGEKNREEQNGDAKAAGAAEENADQKATGAAEENADQKATGAAEENANQKAAAAVDENIDRKTTVSSEANERRKEKDQETSEGSRGKASEPERDEGDRHEREGKGGGGAVAVVAAAGGANGSEGQTIEKREGENVTPRGDEKSEADNPMPRGDERGETDSPTTEDPRRSDDESIAKSLISSHAAPGSSAPAASLAGGPLPALPLPPARRTLAPTSLVPARKTLAPASLSPAPAPPAVSPQLSFLFALGSQDRSVSLWSSSSPRPIAVVRRLFDAQVVDLAWAADGRGLLACSSDGSVALILLDAREIGLPATDAEAREAVRRLYGREGGAAGGLDGLAEDADDLDLRAAGGMRASAGARFGARGPDGAPGEPIGRPRPGGLFGELDEGERASRRGLFPGAGEADLALGASTLPHASPLSKLDARLRGPGGGAEGAIDAGGTGAFGFGADAHGAGRFGPGPDGLGAGRLGLDPDGLGATRFEPGPDGAHASVPSSFLHPNHRHLHPHAQAHHPLPGVPGASQLAFAPPPAIFKLPSVPSLDLVVPAAKTLGAGRAAAASRAARLSIVNVPARAQPGASARSGAALPGTPAGPQAVVRLLASITAPRAAGGAAATDGVAAASPAPAPAAAGEDAAATSAASAAAAPASSAGPTLAAPGVGQAPAQLSVLWSDRLRASATAALCVGGHVVVGTADGLVVVYSPAGRRVLGPVRAPGAGGVAVLAAVPADASAEGRGHGKSRKGRAEGDGRRREKRARREERERRARKRDARGASSDPLSTLFVDLLARPRRRSSRHASALSPELLAALLASSAARGGGGGGRSGRRERRTDLLLHALLSAGTDKRGADRRRAKRARSARESERRREGSNGKGRKKKNQGDSRAAALAVSSGRQKKRRVEDGRGGDDARPTSGEGVGKAAAKAKASSRSVASKALAKKAAGAKDEAKARARTEADPGGRRSPGSRRAASLRSGDRRSAASAASELSSESASSGDERDDGVIELTDSSDGDGEATDEGRAAGAPSDVNGGDGEGDEEEGDAANDAEDAAAMDEGGEEDEENEEGLEESDESGSSESDSASESDLDSAGDDSSDSSDSDSASRSPRPSAVSPGSLFVAVAVEDGTVSFLNVLAGRFSHRTLSAAPIAGGKPVAWLEALPGCGLAAGDARGRAWAWPPRVRAWHLVLDDEWARGAGRAEAVLGALPEGGQGAPGRATSAGASSLTSLQARATASFDASRPAPLLSLLSAQAPEVDRAALEAGLSAARALGQGDEWISRLGAYARFLADAAEKEGKSRPQWLGRLEELVAEALDVARGVRDAPGGAPRRAAAKAVLAALEGGKAVRAVRTELEEAMRYV